MIVFLVFVGKARRVELLKGTSFEQALASITNIRLGCKGLPGTLA
jgi:hypothetical protein